tara:strand:- start:240 stop:1325 length:1086 start_codon:yes stop_codon:yes gene_type:complete
MIEVGIIGGGINSEIGKVHISSLKVLPYNIKCACFSRDKIINKQTKKKYNLNTTKLYDNYKDLLKKEKINLLIILTPTPAHYEIINKAIEKKIPVICEKPITSDLNSAKKIFDKIKKKKIFFCITHNYSYYPMIKEFKKIIKQKKKIGIVKQIFIKYPQDSFFHKNLVKKWRLKRYEINSLSLDLGSHVYSLSEYLLDQKPKKIFANYNSFASNKIIDDIKVLVKYKNNVCGSYWYSKSAIGYKNGLEIEVFGTRGSLQWIQTDPENIVFRKINGEKHILSRDIENLSKKYKEYHQFKAGHPVGFMETMINLYLDVYKNLTKDNKKSKKTPFLYGLNEAYNTIKFLSKLNKSNKERKWINF